MAQPDQFKTAEKFVHLWMHESERVYGDRLVRLKKKAAGSGVYEQKTNETPQFFFSSLHRGALKLSEN